MRLRWRDVDEQDRSLACARRYTRGEFDTPKTQAGVRRIPLSDAALQLVAEWRAPREATQSRTRWCSRRGPASRFRRTTCCAAGSFRRAKRWGCQRATWLTFRRTYSSWAHEKGVPGKVVAQLMGHAKVDTTLNVYTQVIDGVAPNGRRQGRIRIVHDCSQTGGVAERR